MRWIAVWFLCVVGMHSACGLSPTSAVEQYVHTHWGKGEGFTGGTIYAICQSNDGYLWLGTERGLVRFDGAAFTLIQRPIPSLRPIGPVRSLVKDAEGNLWIRLQGAQMLVYRSGDFRNASLSLGFPEETVTAIAPDNHGGVLFSGFGSLSLRYSHGKYVTLANASETPGTIISIAEGRDGRIWMGTRDGGLFAIRNDGHISNAAPSLSDEKINALAAPATGGMWVGTDQGLRFLPSETDANVITPSWNKSCQVLSIIKDRSGSMWAATNRGLVRVTTAGEFSLLPAERSSSPGVVAVYEDSEGSIWFGGSQGLERLQDGVFTTYLQDKSSPQSNGGPVYVDSNARTWFAPVSGGVYILEHGKLNRIQMEDLEHDVVYSITGSGSDVWLGRQHGGLTRITRTANGLTAKTYTQRNGLAQNTVYAVYEDRKGSVWAGTISGGLSHFENDAFTTYSVDNGLNSNTINSIIEGYDGTIWVGTPSGLNAFRHGVWSRWSVADGLPTGEVRSCYEDSQHSLWVITASGLAHRSDGRFVAPSHLPDEIRDQVFGITEDTLGYLWLSTTDRVIRINRERLIDDIIRDNDVRTYGESDGLFGAEGVRRQRSIITDHNGNIWVSVRNGIAKADPQMTLRESRPIRVRIESIAAAGRLFRSEDAPKIAARTRNLTFTFSNASLQSPNKVWYRYQLEGADQDWSDAVQMRQVSYNNLNAGNYRFRVMASYDGILWNGEESDASFSINQAMWQTWWFRICCLILSALGVAIIFRLRTISLSRQLNARFQERLAERTRIAQELHDTLLQSFQGLMLRFQTVDSMLPTKPDQAKIMLDDALDRADSALTESRKAIQNIRNSPNRHQHLSSALASALEEIQAEFMSAEQAAPACSIVVEGKEQILHEYVMIEVIRIAREALRNAFHHAHAGRVEVEISFRDAALRLSFRDDGAGISPSILNSGSRSGHWGLIGMRERTARLGAELNFWSKPGAGTEIELTVPATTAYASPPVTLLGRFYHRMKT